MNRILALTILAACLLMPFRGQADPVHKSRDLVKEIVELSDRESTTAFLDLDIDDGIRDILAAPSPMAADIIDYATTLLGRPYRSGSKGPRAFDCSGFTSYVYSQFGLKLSSSSSAQYTQGVSVSTSEVQPGDLLFFAGRNSRSSRIGHVAMVVSVNEATGDVKFIHAASNGGIRYDNLKSDPYYSSRYIGARRVIGQ